LSKSKHIKTITTVHDIVDPKIHTRETQSSPEAIEFSGRMEKIKVVLSVISFVYGS
jgi:hypothetical protein